MTKKTIGYVELEWTCPNCAANVPGLQKTCTQCGAPQPANVQFHAPVKQELLKDEKKIEEAKKGADFHCPYCGTRNVSGTTICSQCGGDLKDAEKRISGQDVKATPTPAQGQPVPAVPTPQPTKKPSNLLWLILLPVAALMMICCIGAGFLMFRTQAVTGTVQNVSWERSIQIEELHDVILEDWKDQVPSGVKTLSCEQKQRSTDRRVVGSHQVCTQHTVDEGNGAGRVEEVCHDENDYESYPVYDDYCKFPGQRWDQIDSLKNQGNKPNPAWPPTNLTANQREGKRTSVYTVIFKTENGTQKYTTNDEAEFRQCQIGSSWTLNINSLGAVMSIQP